MKITSRLTLTPTAAIALAALFFALGGSAFAVSDRIETPFANQKRCASGAVRGVAVVTGNPKIGIANTPDKFTSARNLFGRKFNCTGKAVQVRRVEQGVFEVRFVGISDPSGVGTGTADAYATVEQVPGGAVRVVVHPAGRDDRADLPFTLVVV